MVSELLSIFKRKHKELIPIRPCLGFIDYSASYWNIPDEVWQRFYSTDDLKLLEINFPKECALSQHRINSYYWFWFSPEFCMEDGWGKFRFFSEGEPNTGVLWPNSRGNGVWASDYKYALNVLFKEKLDKMPLYINDSPVMAHVARWRLRIGK